MREIDERTRARRERTRARLRTRKRKYNNFMLLINGHKSVISNLRDVRLGNMHCGGGNTVELRDMKSERHIIMLIAIANDISICVMQWFYLAWLCIA